MSATIAPRVFFAPVLAPCDGEWMDVYASTDLDEVRAKLAPALTRCFGEEWGAMDSEGFGHIPAERVCRLSPVSIVALAEVLYEMLDDRGEETALAFSLWLEDEYGMDRDLSEAPERFSDAFFGEFSSPEDHAEEYCREVYNLDAMGFLGGYIDWEAVARDFRMGGDFAYLDNPDGGVYVFRNDW